MAEKIAVKVAIIGLNRVTGAMGLMLKAYSSNPKGTASFTVTGNDEDANVLKTAQKNGVVDQTKIRIAEAVKDAQIIIVDQPVGDLDFVYGEIAYGVKPGAVVLDLSPTKQPVIEFARGHFARDGEGQAYLVGIFPLLHASSLYDFQRGVEAADETYLIGGDMIIAPSANVPPEAVKLASDLTDIFQMKPHFLDPYEFDALSDITESLPVVLSLALFNVVRASEGRKDLERILNPNFMALLQHLRANNADDITDMLLNNVDSTRRHINDLIRALAGVRDLLDKENPDMLNESVNQTITDFDDWQARREKGMWETNTTEMQGVGGISLFGNMFGTALEKRLTSAEQKAQSSTRRKRRR